MNAYGILLKKLIQHSNIKLSLLAECVGYDISYISKWCNKDKLPASKSATSVNQSLSQIFAEEIIRQDETASFCSDMNLVFTEDTQELAGLIFQLLKKAYKDSLTNTGDVVPNLTILSLQTLIGQAQIKHYVKDNLIPQIIEHNKDLKIISTIDVKSFVKVLTQENILKSEPNFDLDIKFGLNMQNLDEKRHYVQDIYYLLNRYSFANFNIYDNYDMQYMNMFIIKDLVALQCSLDKNNEICFASVINDIATVNQLYEKLIHEFTPAKLVVGSSSSKDLFYHGYRTEFYSHSKFKIFLTRGFEFLLPPEVMPRLIQASIDQGFDSNMQNIIARLSIAWEEIFEKAKIDFYLLKTSLLQYIQDGVIYFADVRYPMNVEERKRHIERILELIDKNPNIRFHIIDDESIPDSYELIHTSFFSNTKKMFLKNTNQYGRPYGPKFYRIKNDQFINHVSEYLDMLSENAICNTYDAEAVHHFFDTYGTMVMRLLEINI